MKKLMTKKQANAMKQRILGLNWDANIKRAKAVNLAKLLFEQTYLRHAQFTKADYRAFFKARRIKQSWV
ncbi:MAG TPA: hypothetical protein VG075_11140 [Candidatus Acidoferrum sp.]|jgi:hypothetical protein|nr:hypothetical protein [Candidatus Acidoferrum sp.]